MNITLVLRVAVIVIDEVAKIYFDRLKMVIIKYEIETLFVYMLFL